MDDVAPSMSVNVTPSSDFCHWYATGDPSLDVADAVNVASPPAVAVVSDGSCVNSNDADGTVSVAALLATAGAVGESATTRYSAPSSAARVRSVRLRTVDVSPSMF